MSVNDLEKAQKHLSDSLQIVQNIYNETAAEEPPENCESSEAEAHLEMLTSLKRHEADLRTRLVEVSAWGYS